MKPRNLFFLFVAMLLLGKGALATTRSGEPTTRADAWEGMVTWDNPVVSPSGTYTLSKVAESQAGVPGFRVCITEKDAEVAFLSETFYRDRDTSFLCWGEGDTVWLYHGDLGTFFARHQGETWRFSSYAEHRDEVEAPALLCSLRPRLFEPGDAAEEGDVPVDRPGALHDSTPPSDAAAM